MKRIASILFLAVGLCGIICSAEAAVQHPSVSPEDNRSTLVERQRNGVSFGAFKETFTGTEEVFEKDCRNIVLMITTLADLEPDKLFLLCVSILFCSAVMVFGLKKMKGSGKESEQPKQQ